MESHEAKNTMKLLALVFISLAACLDQGERVGQGSGYSSLHGGIKWEAVGGQTCWLGRRELQGGSYTGMCSRCVCVTDGLFYFYYTAWCST